MKGLQKMSEDIPDIDISITSTPIVARTRKLKIPEKYAEYDNSDTIENYRDERGYSIYYDKFKKCRGRFGFTSIRVLEFLNGRKLDDVVLAYVNGLRPSCIRICEDAAHADARTWRVTIWVNENDIVKCINQEIEVWLPEGVRNGYALKHALKYGLDSEQVKWHDDDGIDCIIDGIGGLRKRVNGKLIPFPREEDKK